MKAPQHTIYAKNSGVEIASYEKKSPGKPAEGRIGLRFFTLEGKSRQIRFVAEPWEGFELCRRISKVCQEGGKETLTHKFDGTEGEVVTRLTVERYERNGRTGYALNIQRGEESINVSTDQSHFLYAAELLRHLSVSEAWVERNGQAIKENDTKRG